MMTIGGVLILTAVLGLPGWGAQTVPPPPAEGFQVGDRILLVVEGDSALTDTFTVVAGPAVDLPVIGAVSLKGVARSELEAHMTQELKRYIKNPVVHARALIRLSILGAVLRPGFYAVPTDLVLADALMVAGGPTQEARVDKMHIQRGGSRLWGGEKLQAAIASGATVDALGLRAGDGIDVPKARDAESTVRIIGVLVTIPIAVCVVTKGC